MTDPPSGPRRPIRIIRGTVGLAVFTLLLELVTRSALVDPAYLPPASSVLRTTAELLADPAFLANVAGTLAAWAFGMALAMAIAIPLGVAIGSSRRRELAATAAIELGRPIPSVALIPLAILLLGRDLDMRILLVAYAASWPILLNTITGVREADPVALETARAFGLSRWTTARRVVLPSAAPFAVTGIRISASIALIVAVSAELIAGGGPGIGTWMLTASQAGVPRELLYAGIVVAGLLGLVLDAMLAAGERRLFAWHHRERGLAA